MVLAIVWILVAGLAPLVSQTVQRDRADETRRELELLKEAIVGTDAAAGILREEADFGFVGDLGRLPDSLPELLRGGSLPAYQVDDERRLGVGWRGPYVSASALPDPTDPTRDRFGRALRYAVKDTTIAGRASAGFLRSAGPDGLQDTPDDLVAPLLEGEVRARLHGFVVNRVGRGLIGAPARVVFRRDGVIADTVVLTDGLAQYVVGGVAVGPAFVQASVGPAGQRIAMEHGSEAISGRQSNTVELTLNNASPEPVTLTRLVVFLPAALSDRCYRSASLGGVRLFPAGTNVRCSGDTLTFNQAVTLESGMRFSPSVARASFPMRGPVSFAPHLVSAGGPLGEGIARLVLGDWRGNNGVGAPISMLGVQLTAVFSDGLSVSFTTPGG